MQNNIFTKEFEVHYYEVDKYEQATPITLLNFLEDSAISHSSSVGYGVNQLKSQNIGWILNRWHIKIDKSPSLNQRVIVETWASQFERFYGTRQFLIRDSNEDILAKASSLWIFFDIERRRPKRIPPEVGAAFSIKDIKVIDEPFSDLNSSIIAECINESNVKRSDIDTNNHVNNKKYVEWILESIPEEVYNNSSISSLEIEYKKESSLGDSICTGFSKSQDSFLHKIWDKNTMSELASARTTWKKI